MDITKLGNLIYFYTNFSVLFFRIESLLKLVEIPFVYSFIVLPFVINTDFTPTSIFDPIFMPYILILGILGTFLAIFDPIGRASKVILKKYNYGQIHGFLSSLERINQNKYSSQSFPSHVYDKLDESFTRHAVNTNSILLEINKIVGIFYFFVILLFFAAFSFYSPFVTFFMNMFTAMNFCNQCFFETQLLLIIPLSIFTALTVLALIMEFFQVMKRTRTVAIYLLSIYDNKATEDKVMKMLQFIENKQWELAEAWSHSYIEKYEDKRKAYFYTDIRMSDD